MDLIYFGRTASEFRCDTLTESDRKSASLRSRGAVGHARSRDFLQQLQRDLPRPASVAKTFRFASTPNHPYNSRHPVPR